MATIKVCDECGRKLDDKDLAPLDFGNGRYLSLPMDMEICRYCLADAVAKRDDRVKEAPAPPLSNLRYHVSIDGCKSRAPHAAFEFSDHARRFIDTCTPGGAIDIR